MTYEKIKTVADALCVDILDLIKDLLSNKELLHMILSDENFSDKLLSALHGAMEELGENYKDASGLPAIRIDFPYEIESEHSPDDSEFEFDLLDQAMDAFLYDVTAPDSDPALTEIFLDHLDKCCEIRILLNIQPMICLNISARGSKNRSINRLPRKFMKNPATSPGSLTPSPRPSAS